MKKWMIVILVSLFLMNSALIFSAGVTESKAPTPEKPLILRGGHTGTPQNMMHLTLVHWAKLVEAKTNGAVLIQVYPSEQLGNERTLIENTNLGTIEWCLSGSGGVSRFVPAFGMFENAFNFASLKHFTRVGNGSAFGQVGGRHQNRRGPKPFFNYQIS